MSARIRISACSLSPKWKFSQVYSCPLALASQTKEQWYVAPLQLLGVELLLRAHGIIEAAETELQVAMRVARRASMSMARLWRDQATGRRPAIFSRRSTAGSPKGLTRAI
jgi:hypothetical protein